MIIGSEGIDALQGSCVAIFGIGGVGSFVTEALARAGVEKIHLFDHDTIVESNINRQIIALHSTLGRYKVDVMKERILDINPDADVIVHPIFFDEKTVDMDLFQTFDYIVDAIDTVTSKLLLVVTAQSLNIPIISSMGTGNKLDPTQFEISDISKTSVCPLAKVMRKELKNRGIVHLKVLYSKEQVIKPSEEEFQQMDNQEEAETHSQLSEQVPPVRIRKRQTPGSISFVPSVAGLIIAGEVIKDLMKIKSKQPKQ